MAGDPNLSGPRGADPSSASIQLPDGRDSAHDAAALALWLSWLTRVRWAMPLVLVPLSYVISRLLDTEYHTGAVASVLGINFVVNYAMATILRELSKELARNADKLRWLASAQTMIDTLLMAVAVHEAGSAIGPFWPFPFIPLMLGAVLLPSMRVLLRHGVFAFVCTAISAWDKGAADVAATLLMSLFFVAFGGLVAYVLGRGVQQQRAARRELRHTQADKELAQAMARRREEILSVVSHELASPLMTLRGYVLLMKESSGRDHGNDHLFERIERQVGRLSSLADDLLEMASTRAGALNLQRAPFDLVTVLQELREGVRLQFPDADVRVTGEARMPGVWDRHRLDQLFGNLVSNAVKFGGARCRIDLEVTRANDHEVLVRVSDNGPGISANALRNIFEPFQRYSTERGGLGLGLAIAQTVVEMHDGRIWAESPQGQGAVFHVVLPTDAAPSGKQPVVDPVRERVRLGAS